MPPVAVCAAVGGIVIAVGVFLNPDFEPERRQGPAQMNLYLFYTGWIRKRFSSFYKSFETVLSAQLIISAINTVLTAIFVFATGIRYERQVPNSPTKPSTSPGTKRKRG